MSILLYPFFRFLLWLFGWKFTKKISKNINKSVIIIAPHTSNWDFVIGICANFVLRLKVHYIAKKELFVPPFGFIFRFLGGIPIDRSKSTNSLRKVINIFSARKNFKLCLAPEGTRSFAKEWKTGFYYIATKAQVPIYLSYIDYHKKEGGISEIFYPSGNIEKDMKEIKDFYKEKLPLYPKKSSIEHIRGKTSLFNPFKTSFKLLLVILLTWLAINFSMVWYGIQQAYWQIHIIYKAKPVTTYLNDPSYATELKEKIKLIEEIKQFAFDSIGLDFSNSYNKLYDQQGKPILWLLTGCKIFQLEAKTWDFPFLGTFSYKGFFNLKALKKEEKKLIAQGYETHIRKVSAWSTLGILNDPILSNILKYNEGELANTIIHELTHSTLFIKDKLEYNENLANFVGDIGAEKFLKYKFGKNSYQYTQYIQTKIDRQYFSNYVLLEAKKIEELYSSFNEHWEYEEKLNAKENFIENFIEKIDTLQFYNEKYYHYFKNFTPNNNFFLSYRRYNAKKNQFREEFENHYNRDFKIYFKYLKRKYPSIFP